jgi:hypothetical protein
MFDCEIGHISLEASNGWLLGFASTVTLVSHIFNVDI